MLVHERDRRAHGRGERHAILVLNGVCRLENRVSLGSHQRCVFKQGYNDASLREVSHYITWCDVVLLSLEPGENVTAMVAQSRLSAVVVGLIDLKSVIETKLRTHKDARRCLAHGNARSIVETRHVNVPHWTSRGVRDLRLEVHTVVRRESVLIVGHGGRSRDRDGLCDVGG